MIIKILKGEHLFSEAGTHVCDANGIAIAASVDTDCEVDDIHAERVLNIVTQDRANRGLDPEGNHIIPAITTEEVQ